VTRHLTTLAALISGIVGRKSTQWPNVAANIPDGTTPESRVKRFARWLKTDPSTDEASCVPYAEIVLWHVALQTRVLVMDGRVVGRGCVALRLHVVDPGRALPLVWQVRQGKQGHCPAARHIALVTQVHKLIPPGAQVVLLGDGACDGTTLQQTVQEYRWSYGVRTGSNFTVAWDGDSLRCATVGACLKPGTLVAFKDARVTDEAYGPILLLGCWAQG